MTLSTFGMFGTTPFASADTVDIDVSNTVIPDALELLFSDVKDPLEFLSTSLYFPWDRIIEESLFVNSSLSHDSNNFHAHNEQPTPLPYKNNKYQALSSLSPSNLDQTDAPLPNIPKSQNKAYNKEEKKKKRPNDNCTFVRRRKSHDARTKTGGHNHLEPTKRQIFLERNRMAANRCRQRKRELAQFLESRLKEISERKNELEGEISELCCQILDFKSEVLKHAHCGDARIEQHLAQVIEHLTHQNKPTDTVGTVRQPIHEL